MVPPPLEEPTSQGAGEELLDSSSAGVGTSDVALLPADLEKRQLDNSQIETQPHREPEHSTSSQGVTRPTQDPWRGTVPVARVVLYSIGGLIIGIAICSFLLGWSMARGLAPVQIAAASNPRIHGRVSYVTSDGRTVGDSEAVVLALPRRKKPDEKFDVTMIRPEKVSNVRGNNPTVSGIQAIGGDFALTNRSGDYELDVSESGEYYLLALSSHVARSVNQPPTTTEIVELGQYFRQANVLLGKNDFVWSKHVVHREKRFDATFGN